MSKNALIIFHIADLDGKGSGYIALKGLQEKYEFQEKNIDIIGYNYEDYTYLNEKIDFQKYCRVICVDIRIPEETIQKFFPNTNITIIDHHEISNEYMDIIKKYDVELFHSTELAAIHLTWKYFYDSNFPKWVQLLGDYDRWFNEDKEYWEKEVMPFQMYMRAFRNDLPDSNIWKVFEEFDEEEYTSAIFIGTFIWMYDKNMKRIIAEKSYEVKFEGLNALVCNSPLRGSQLFDSIYDENNHDIMIVYNFNGHDYIYSLYTTKDHIDCSKICRKYGGGGHKKAAGFRSKDKLV